MLDRKPRISHDLNQTKRSALSLNDVLRSSWNCYPVWIGYAEKSLVVPREYVAAMYLMNALPVEVNQALRLGY